MRTFKLVRKVDVSGVSGTGVVAEGVIFHDGQAVLSWFGQHHSVAVYPSIDDIIVIHGHDGATDVRFEDDEWNSMKCGICGLTHSPSTYHGPMQPNGTRVDGWAECFYRHLHALHEIDVMKG